ncbi:MAG: hypothetical protein Q9226_008392 [Calogaya cf. arnoldii]
MPRPSTRASRRISIEVERANLRLRYGDDGSKSFGVPVVFDEAFISITHTAGGKSCVTHFETGNLDFKSFEISSPSILWGGRGFIEALYIEIDCHNPPKCEVTSTRGRGRLLNVETAALGQYSSQMHSMQLEIVDFPTEWTVLGGAKAFSLMALKNRLEDLYALKSYISSTEKDLYRRFTIKSEPTDESPPDNAIVASYDRVATSSTAGNSLNTNPSNNRANRSPLLTGLPSPTSVSHPPSLPRPASLRLPKNPPLPTSPSIASLLLPPTLPTSATLQHPSVLKHKVEEMEAHYNKIEEEEKEFAGRTRERKEQLWQKLRSSDTPTPTRPQHPSGLKRKLEEMEVQYDGIEKEEEEFMVRCGKRKTELWQGLHSAGF